MKLKVVLFIPLLFLLLASCKQEEIIITDPAPEVDPNADAPPMLWQAVVHKDTFSSICMQPVVYNDRIFCSAVSGFTESTTCFMVNADGLRFWSSDAVFEEDCNDVATPPNESVHLYQNYLTLLCNSDPRVVDLETGEVLWHYEVPGGDHGPFLTGFGNTIFHTYAEGVNPFTKSTLVKANVIEGIWDTIYTVDMVDDYSVDLYPPTAQIQIGGDTILYFQNRKYTVIPFPDGWIDMIAYNMSADSVVWQQTNFDAEGTGTVWAPIVYNNYVFYQGAKSIFCFNKTNGQLLWNWLAPTGDDLIFSKLIVKEGYLYIMTSLGGIYALNYSTGGIRWSNISLPGEPSQLEYFDKTLYLTSSGTGLLYAIDATNGTVLWTLESPNSGNPDTFDARFENAPTIDPVTHRLYITDRYYLICYSLN